MNIEELREYCLSFKNAFECLPFGDEYLVFKIENKMFALMPLDGTEPAISLKCDPDEALVLRDHYRAVEPAFHFNKKYWNTIFLERDMDDHTIKRWIRHSYLQVIAKLPKYIRSTYQNEHDL